MEDYSRDSVMGFIRYSCHCGYRKYVLPDAGSQLSCEDMRNSFIDIKHRLLILGPVLQGPLHTWEIGTQNQRS